MTDQRDDFERIYGGCLTLPVMRTIMDVVRRQGRWDPEWARSARDLGRLHKHSLHHEFLEHFESIVGRVRQEYDVVLGPRIHLVGGPDIPLDSFVVDFDFDSFGDEQAGGGLRLSDSFEWEGSAFSRAARAYRSECRWDFAPGEAGIWLGYVAVTESAGGGDFFSYSGNLLGFAAIYDRDKDGVYESLGHLWTATGVRRKGVGRKLVEQARQRYPLRVVEGPVTAMGRALLGKAWPGVLG